VNVANLFNASTNGHGLLLQNQSNGPITPTDLSNPSSGYSTYNMSAINTAMGRNPDGSSKDPNAYYVLYDASGNQVKYTNYQAWLAAVNGSGPGGSVILTSSGGASSSGSANNSFGPANAAGNPFSNSGAPAPSAPNPALTAQAHMTANAIQAAVAAQVSGEGTFSNGVFVPLMSDPYAATEGTVSGSREDSSAGLSSAASAQSGYVSASVDSRGNVFGIDAEGNKKLLYDSPGPGKGIYVSASVDANGNVFGFDAQGNRKLLYDNPHTEQLSQ
jgi:hypothetical protein